MPLAAGNQPTGQGDCRGDSRAVRRAPRGTAFLERPGGTCSKHEANPGVHKRSPAQFPVRPPGGGGWRSAPRAQRVPRSSQHGPCNPHSRGWSSCNIQEMARGCRGSVRKVITKRKNITTSTITNLKKAIVFLAPFNAGAAKLAPFARKIFVSGSKGHPVSSLSALEGRRAATMFFQVSSDGGGSSFGFLVILVRPWAFPSDARRNPPASSCRAITLIRWAIPGC